MKKLNQKKMVHIQGGYKWLQCALISAAGVVTLPVTGGGGVFLLGFSAACWASYLDSPRQLSGAEF